MTVSCSTCAKEWPRDPEYSTIPANIQRSTLRRLDGAYKTFFRRLRVGEKAGFPRFKSKNR
jgi:putative transposase